MWITSLFPGRSFDFPRQTRLSPRRSISQRRSAAPRLEVLEDRTVLSTLTVINTNDSGPGSLRQAILDANSNGATTNTIQFAPALAGQTITLTSGELDITKSLNIVGSAETISGNNSSRVFAFDSGTDTLSGLVITNGKSTSTSLGGGGILNEANLTLIGVALTHNTAVLGGGIENADGGTLTVDLSVIAENTATNGGGIINSGSTLTVNASLVTGNSASTAGGGVDNSNGGTVTLNFSVVAGNSAPMGPNINGPFTAHNSIVGGVFFP